VSTTVTSSPPRGQAGPPRQVASGGQAAHRAPRSRFRIPRASTTPARLRLLLAGLVALCLAWGALATLMVSQHASAAREVAANAIRPRTLT
jgi:hypothetical protein